MSDYNSCLMQGYGVLPGPPSRLKPVVVSSHYTILDWKAPKILPDTVTTYHVNWRKLGSGDDYGVLEKVTLLEFVKNKRLKTKVNIDGTISSKVNR